MRKQIAALVIACFVSSNFAGCSQPIDNGSQIPAQSQPFVALLALLGVGIALTALHHHNVRNNSGGGGTNVNLVAPLLVEGLGNQPFDIAVDPSSFGGVGALGTQGGAGRYGFIEVLSSGTINGSYALPSGYQPRALAIDGAENDWFVDGTGAVKKCPAPTPGVTVCTPSLSFSDGLTSSGIRSIAADGTHLLIELDNQVDTVSWAAFMLDGSARISGSYTYTPGLGAFNNDAVVATTGSSAISTFMIFHKDGRSWTVLLPVATKNAFALNPPPSGNVAADAGGNFYGFLGSATSGEYQIGHYVGTGFGVTPGSLTIRETVAFNGQTNPNNGRFSVPLAAVRTEPQGFDIFALDPSGNLVVFSTF